MVEQQEYINDLKQWSKINNYKNWSCKIRKQVIDSELPRPVYLLKFGNKYLRYGATCINYKWYNSNF